ncbi:MAG: BPL-N domain-containing protein [Bdellovibrionales bacterium]
MKYSFFYSLFLVLGLTTSSAFAAGNIALIYKGPGACVEECSEASALIAKMAGLEPRYVGPNETDPAIFNNAKIWIQPGGFSVDASLAMRPALKKNLVSFVENGGAYVGFCAGGFLATSMIGRSEYPGLGFVPGSTRYFNEVDENGIMVNVNWKGKTRHLYYEGGPRFDVPQNSGVQILSRYADGSVESLQTTYGLGRVAVTGTHPEAPLSWRQSFGLTDRDGLDLDIAVELVRWAAR